MTLREETNLAERLLDQSFDELSNREQHVIEALVAGEPVAENVNKLFEGQSSLGERLADTLAKVVGSWGFIISFLVFLVTWILLNSFVLNRINDEFDPYPYILLNLFLSTLASIQAPVIMMSQNRQSEKDRIAASNAFEVSLKTELAIQQLHEKLDKMGARSNER
jgi:uncharacterized membrane protein